MQWQHRVYTVARNWVWGNVQIIPARSWDGAEEVLLNANDAFEERPEFPCVYFQNLRRLVHKVCGRRPLLPLLWISRASPREQGVALGPSLSSDQKP